MAKPTHLYKIEEGQFVAHTDDTRSITLQQVCPLGRDHAPDSLIYVNRQNAAKLIDALQDWLSQ